MVQQTLIRNSHKITPKLNINLQEIKDNNQQLPFNSINVALTIKELANKAPGPSKLRKPHFTNLPPNMIRNITHLFNCSYATGMYPTQFKTAEIILFPKETGEKSNPMNYRPISLLNFLGKVYAKLLNQKLVKHLEDNGIIKESQHGFRRKKSTSTLIAQLYERIAREKCTYRKTMITMILRDISKAFDKIWHKGLIYKMMQTGMNAQLLRSLSNFLHNRKAYIKVNKTKGPLFSLHAGVPQGDVLSPTLFLIMCNDYPEPRHDRTRRNFCKQYADDFTQVIINKFTSTINDARREIHRQNILHEINRQNEYELKWKLKNKYGKIQTSTHRI